MDPKTQKNKDRKSNVLFSCRKEEINELWITCQACMKSEGQFPNEKEFI